MKVLTVAQPWAWAIIYGGKDVENRTQAWTYRGPLAIHAAQRISRRGLDFLYRADADLHPHWAERRVRSAIIGVVDLTGAHRAVPDCCDSAWAEQDYTQRDGIHRSDIVHLQLANPRRLNLPVPAKGRLGLWNPDPDLRFLIDSELEAAGHR